MIFWPFLIAIFSNFAATTGQSIPASKIYSLSNSANTARLYYTNLTEISVLEDYDPSNYPNPIDLNIGVLIDKPAGCGCPDLREIHQVATSSGKLRFELAGNLKSGMKDYGLAGYLAPFPGYCGSDGIEVMEFYSDVLEEFRYDTSNNIWNYYQDFTNFFRPVRVLGYGYYSTNSVWLSGTPPFVKQGLTGMAYKSLSVRFDMVQTLTKDGKTSYAVSPELISQLISQGWSRTGSVLPGPLSAQNNLDIITEKCGSIQRCVEILDTRTGIVRLQNFDSQVLQGEMQSTCGYFLSQTATGTSCFPQALQYFSYIPSYNNDTAIYGNYNDGGSGNAVGFVYPYTFLFLKL